MNLPLDLTADEIRILTDSLGNEDKEDGKVIAKPLLLLLGSAFLEMLPPEAPKAGTVTIRVTEPQAWLLRSKVNSGMRTDRQPKLGLECLAKLYRLLLAFDAAEATGTLADATLEGTRDRQWSDEDKAQFVSDPDADLSNWDGLAGTAA